LSIKPEEPMAGNEMGFNPPEEEREMMSLARAVRNWVPS
jgi:hypothetical protein